MRTLLSSTIRSAAIRSNFIKPSIPSIIRNTMTTPAFVNSELKIQKLFNVEGYTAVVTGGGTGIGLMITQALVSNGAKVYITGRRMDTLNTVVEKYSDGGQIIP